MNEQAKLMIIPIIARYFLSFKNNGLRKNSFSFKITALLKKGKILKAKISDVSGIAKVNFKKTTTKQAQ